MLTENNRKAELSYEYVRTLARAAGLACSEGHRRLLGSGVDVRLEIRERLDSQSQLQHFSLDFHLHATSRRPALVGSKLAASLEVERYDSLRGTTAGLPRFAVLLALPEEPENWLTVSVEELIERHSARWLCLQGAPETVSPSEINVLFPVWNVLTPAALREIARRVSLGGRFFHEQ